MNLQVAATAFSPCEGSALTLLEELRETLDELLPRSGEEVVQQLHLDTAKHAAVINMRLRGRLSEVR